MDIEATTVEDVNLKTIIEKIKRSTAVDGSVDVGSEDPYSVDAFMNALKEETAASGEFFGDKGVVVTEGGSAAAPQKSVETLLAEMQVPGSALTWVSFSVNC